MALKPASVSELNRYIKNLLTGDPLLSAILLTGEISSWSPNSRTGAVFFTLKDEHSQIDCVMWGQAAGRMTISYDVGMKVNLQGRIDYWNNRGQIRFNTVFIEPAGEGELNARYEELKKRLYDEGLFDTEKKKPLPFFPDNVAVITSPEGSAVWDIKKTITEKNDLVNIYIYPVKVQGQGAAEDIAAAVRNVNSCRKKTDIIIVARGGGSPEERWAFNEECVVRSIYESTIPVVTGIGHEDNESLADLAADYYAKTPTAAAYAAVPDTNELREDILLRAEMMDRTLTAVIREAEYGLLRHSPVRHREMMMRRVSQNSEKIDKAAMDQQYKMHQIITEDQNKTEMIRITLDALNPHNIMSRGYSIVKDKNGTIITDTSNIKVFDELDIILNNGKLLTEVRKIRSGNDD